MSRHLDHLDGQIITVYHEDDTEPSGMRRDHYEFRVVHLEDVTADVIQCEKLR
jgi:hypothetical protein